MSGLIGKKIGMTSLLMKMGKTSLAQLLRLGHVWLPKSKQRSMTGMKQFS